MKKCSAMVTPVAEPWMRPPQGVARRGRGGVRAKRSLMAVVRQALCGLREHDLVMQFERDRLFLRCDQCGYESAGWDVGRRRARPSYDRPVQRSRRRTSAAGSR
ncbi:MAG: hypothetical protein HYX76_10535 [Acidobacteria bacterium]|nr:hypothetical protein [Acidobacteriota bacterium]